MKIHYKIAAVALMLGFVVQTKAQDGSTSAQASIGATIVAPLVVAKTADMNFGSIAVGDHATDIHLQPDGTLSSPFSETHFVPSSGATAASFTVAGADLSYSISILKEMPFLEDGKGNTIYIRGFSDSKGGSSMVSGGIDTFTVGATLALQVKQPVGFYTGRFDVFVNYQ